MRRSRYADVAMRPLRWLAVAPLFLLVLALWPRYRQQSPASFDSLKWNQISEHEVQELAQNFARDGFAVVRGAVPAEAIDVLAARRPRSASVLLYPIEALMRMVMNQDMTLDGLWVGRRVSPSISPVEHGFDSQ